MKERTATESIVERAAPGRQRRAAPGVVILFQRGEAVVVAHRIARSRRVGRDEAADVTIDDPKLSRFHARIEPGSGGVRVTDLGSRNGAFIDGARVVEAATPAPVGSVVRLGKTLLLVVRDVAPFELEPENPFPALVGGPALAGARERIATLGPLASPVLVEGETGTGKEVVARLLHEVSGRSGRFVAVNCATLGGELTESELFGHSRGAFSGASGQRAGLFRAADGGTLLLDELGDLPPPAQAKLLRVIETGGVRALGEDVETTVSVRIVASTHRSLDDMANQGLFRKDLLHRIAGSRIRLPPLRERLEDIPRIVARVLASEDLQPSAGLLDALMRRSWPGNVRELRHTLASAAEAARSAGRREVRGVDLDACDARVEGDPLRTRVIRALTSAEGNVARAARELEVPRTVLYETLRRLGLDPASFRGT